MAITILEERPLGAQTVRGTVLFVDLRGYTTLAEGLSPDTVAALLEEFFSTLTPSVDRNGGTVFHLAGDSLMAGFGLADDSVAPVRAAIDASRAMIAAFQPVAINWERRLGIPTGIGVGVHVGNLAFVTLGPPSLRRSTLVGDTVNVAARLCQRARAGEVLFSAGVAASLDPATAGDVIPLPALALRGRASPVAIYCVPAPARAGALIRHDEMIAVPPAQNS
ncbi:MAG: adenylate/guanylate cyclase domain-containing protein [Pseudomonadota bacterium]